MEKIRNFSIIAHIDHGKSTLSDRFLEIAGLKDSRQKDEKRVLDTLDLEQEKGITIKLQPVRMDYDKHILNLIDTPGHVDFGYEVSRSLKACEGAILLVDATQGVQAQTISTMNKAKTLGLKIIPVLNKIDCKTIDITKRKLEFHEILGFDIDEILLASAKTGEGAEEILKTVIAKIPPPQGNSEKPLQALIFDSFYDEHKGVVVAVRIFEGKLAKRDQLLHLLKTGTSFTPKEFGVFKPDFTPTKTLSAGEVGYIATGLKNIKLFTVGDTISDTEDITPLSGYKPPKPNVFATLFPTNPDEFPAMSESITKLNLNDAALTIAQQKSSILGSGFVCGFLGMLHMEIIQERLEREYGISLIITAPSVEYKIEMTNSKEIIAQSANDFPDPSQIVETLEPWAEVEIFTPQEYIGVVMKLCQNNRGIYKDTKYLSEKSSSFNYTILMYEIPLMSLITGFFNRLKSISHGYASLDYKLSKYKPADVVKVSILVNKKDVPSLSFLEIRELADTKSRKILSVLKETIPRHQFKISLQAAIGAKIIAREDIGSLGKNVTEKLYGGDITRKKKLLERQKKGKKRLREIGGVNIPQKAFLAVVQA
ncbi:MAG: translation elongation factor 4 [Patescibacteria group bacterium]|nr:translation elongation factor 4 [Patescibacteria group bacterium]